MVRRPPDRRQGESRRQDERQDELIDDLKHEVPIGKRQIFSDGDEEWGGAC